MNPTSTSKNRLQFEKSPYLLQHADNPVDWYPWCQEAFEKAQTEHKAIFLSIGYSTCHWCHVMAHESFEDAEVARLMNDTFVSIKVDREERPDIDHIYMTVCQLLTGGGGWPLTIIMAPDQQPFYAATYLPKQRRFGQIGMLELIPHIQALWQHEPHRVFSTAGQVMQALHQMTAPANASDETLSKDEVFAKAYRELTGRFDEQYGGFGDAPKFPTPHTLLFLLRYWKRTGSADALRMVETTLHAMRRGGIYDHLGFGFHRYSTDNQWLTPHFEKMLYDQALLAMAYIEAYQATHHEEYARTTREIFAYVLRDMTAPEGGFYSAEDADSEGSEGKFYLWTQAEIRRIFTPEEAEFVSPIFNIKQEGNFQEQTAASPTGENILHLKQSLAELEPIEEKFAQIRQRLFDVRAQRVHPHKDDKILTDWNGLMIAALAKGAQAFDAPEYADAAARAAQFILTKLRRNDKRLLHRYRDGEAAVPAYADDYAFFIWGLIELYEATFNPKYLKHALKLNADFLAHFWDAAPTLAPSRGEEEGDVLFDQEIGGFFFTADDSEPLPIRQKHILDQAIPSSNAVALLNLLRLGRLTANPKFEENVSCFTAAISGNLMQSPSAYAQTLSALDFAFGPSPEVIIVGDSHSEDTKTLLRTLRATFLPNITVILRPTDQSLSDVLRLAPYLESYTSLDGKATAYVCRNYVCQLPTTDAQAMLTLCEETSHG